ncbi:hypothetical protein KEM55_008474, partial [Ascosphaera atra]
LKYHPDRNPGKENEVVPKFQQLGAANEILTTPSLKQKYDAERARAARTFQRADARRQSRGAAWSAQAQYAQSFANGYRPPPRPSATRQSAYTRQQAKPSWQDAYEEPRRAADAFRAFQNMHRDARAGTGQPRPGPAPTAKKKNNPSTNPQRPQSAYEKTFFTDFKRRERKKNGFSPDDPNGDEPMARKGVTNMRAFSPHQRKRLPTDHPVPARRTRLLHQIRVVLSQRRASIEIHPRAGEIREMSNDTDLENLVSRRNHKSLGLNRLFLAVGLWEARTRGSTTTLASTQALKQPLQILLGQVCGKCQAHQRLVRMRRASSQ